MFPLPPLITATVAAGHVTSSWSSQWKSFSPLTDQSHRRFLACLRLCLFYLSLHPWLFLKALPRLPTTAPPASSALVTCLPVFLSPLIPIIRSPKCSNQAAHFVRLPLLGSSLLIVSLHFIYVFSACHPYVNIQMFIWIPSLPFITFSAGWQRRLDLAATTNYPCVSCLLGFNLHACCKRCSS